MRFRRLVSTIVTGLALWGSPVLAQTQGQPSGEKETPIQLSQVPQPAMNAARQALGTDPTGANLVTGTRQGQNLYELEAKTAQGETSVHVTADGKVVKREQGGD